MALLTVPVASFTSRGTYTVDLARRSCTCPSYAFRSMPCKHMVYVQRMASDLTDLPPTARMNPENVIPMPSYTNDKAWYAVDFVNKTCTCTGFQFRRECKHVEDALELEKMFTENVIQIPSYSSEGVWYSVDIIARTCSCPHYVHRRTECKHLQDALELKEMFFSEHGTENDSESSVNGDIYEQDSDSEEEVTSAYYSGEPSEESENSEEFPLLPRRSVRRRLFVEEEFRISNSDSDSNASDMTWVPGLYSNESDDSAEFERKYLVNWRTM